MAIKLTIIDQFASNSPDARLEVGNGTATAIDGTDDLLVADDAEIDGDLYVEGSLNLTGTLNGANIGSSGSNGSVQFSDSGILSSNAATFFWDDDNTRMGIGLASPSETLEVNGSITIAASGEAIDQDFSLMAPTHLRLLNLLQMNFQ